MDEPRFWEGTIPHQCQKCLRTIGLVFFEKKTAKGWGRICPGCAHKIDGGKTGAGIGAKFKLDGEGRWREMSP